MQKSPPSPAVTVIDITKDKNVNVSQGVILKKVGSGHAQSAGGKSAKVGAAVKSSKESKKPEQKRLETKREEENPRQLMKVRFWGLFPSIFYNFLTCFRPP